MGFKIGF